MNENGIDGKINSESGEDSFIAHTTILQKKKAKVKSLDKKKNKDDDSLSFSKYQNKEEVLSESEEDIETKMKRLINIKKEGGDYKVHLNVKSGNPIDDLIAKEESPTHQRNKSDLEKKEKIEEEKSSPPDKKLNIEKKDQPSTKMVRKENKKKTKKKEEAKDVQNNSRELSYIEVKNVKKIQSKKRKLELLQRKQNEYLNLIENQKSRRENEVKLLDQQIAKQNSKFDKLKEGISVSNTESGMEDDYNPQMRIENGIALLEFTIKNNIAFKTLYFFERFCLIYGNGGEVVNDNQKQNQEKKGSEIDETKERQQTKEENKTSTARDGSDYYRKGTFNMVKKKVGGGSDNNNYLDGGEGEGEIDEENYYDNNNNINNEEEDPNDDTFIKVNPYSSLEKPIDKSQLVEYDTFYKEQFFKNEVFKYDVDNIQDKEENEINKEMHKLEVKRKLTEKKKLKEVNDLKGFDTSDLTQEIITLQKEYEKIKKKEEPPVELEMNNTEKLLYKGRILGYYFNEEGQSDFPKFALKPENEVGAEEIIDFKILRKEEQARRFFDYCCCLEQRKKINKVLVYARFWCRFFVDNWIFDYLSLGVIIANTILILISDPTDNNNIGNVTDNYFLYFYTVEAVLKIIAFRFFAAEDAYIKDYWNILDFFVVVAGWVLFIIERAMNGTKISGLAGLRAFRILRPLKTVKRFKGLKKLVTALLLSLGHLGETGIVLFFFFLIFAIGGRQMWQGLFFRRCMNVNYGYLYSTQKSKQMCSFDSDCNDLTTYGMRFICAKGYRNPDQGALNFDNVLTGFVTIFVMATLEGWTDIFTYVTKTFKDKIYVNPIIVFLYFHFFIFLANFYLLKLFLAVTNAEYEHIEVSRRELTEKKSFFKLLQSKYDLKAKEKKEKKEKEKQLKINNNKKSDEALRDLYYKVVDEAFSINKNRRNIPILYSTVKDMYIMTNNNPEEIYLQSHRIDEEETFLSKDIKRQQREIDKLIDEKVAEMKRNAKDMVKGGSQRDEEENIEEILRKVDTKNSGSHIGRLNSKKEITKAYKKNVSMKNDLIPAEIRKQMKGINCDLIELSIDNTQKYLKETMINLHKDENKDAFDFNEQDNLKRKIEKKEMEKLINNQIIFLDDLQYEKEVKEQREKIQKEIEERRKRENNEKRLKMQLNKNMLKNNNSSCREKNSEKDKDSEKEKNQKLLTDSLTFMSDLSLSRIKNSDDEDESRSKNSNNVSMDNQSLLNEEEIKQDMNNRSAISDDNENMLNEKIIKINEKEDFYSKVKFKHPYSIFSTVLKLQNDKEIQSKLQIMRKRFNLQSYLKKEVSKGVKTNELGRKKSFLKFLQYTQKPKNLKEFIKEEEGKPDDKNSFLGAQNNNNNINQNIEEQKEHSNHVSNNNISIIKANDKSNIPRNAYDLQNRSNVSFLSKDSNLTLDGGNNVSLDDIEFLPPEIREYNQVLPKNNTCMENIKKNAESNKLIDIIRNSVFDRNSVNTNTDLTSKEQTKYYRRMNKKLNDNLFINILEPRGRNVDKNDINISHVEEKKNYDDFLQEIDENKEEEFADKTNQNNINNNNNKNDDTSNNNIINTENISENKPKEKMKDFKTDNTQNNNDNNNKNNNNNKTNDKSYEDFISKIKNKIKAKEKQMASERNNLQGETDNLDNNENKDNSHSNNKTNSINNNNINSNFLGLNQNIIEHNNTHNLNKADETTALKGGQANKGHAGKDSKKAGFYIFKAKSIEKNKDKYPVENSNNFLVREENRPYTDPLTIKQESIPDNLRGKKYYMNYLYNILDKDLKVKDTFGIGHWVGEILGKKEKFFKKKPLPESVMAFFVFNEKKLNLKRYVYTYHQDREFDEEECSYISHNLKYLPINCLQLTPIRLRDFGKYFVGKEINIGALGNKSNSMNLFTFGQKNQMRQTNSRSGKTYSTILKNKSNLTLCSAFSNHYKVQDEIKMRKNLNERVYKKIDEFNYRTLSHYFLEEESLSSKFIDEKKRSEICNQLEELNRNKQSRLEVKSEIESVKIFDMKTNSHIYVQWSGADVLCHVEEDENRKRWNKMIDALENFNTIIWSENKALQNGQKIKYAFYTLATWDMFDYFVILVVIVNSVFMAIDGNIIKPEVLSSLNISNYVFNGVFMFEYLIKFIGLGPIVYYSDAFTYLDTFIIAFAIVDMATPTTEDTDTLGGSKKNVSSQLSFLRVFRIFRVVRLTKVLKRIKSLRLIIVSIKKALINVSYIICIILMFILIFELLGMSLLSGNSHYQSFLEAFYTTYQILTLEAWNELLIEMWPMNYLCFIFFLAWIVLGNFVLMNLFVSVLLQSFGEGGDEEEDDDLTENERIEHMYTLPDYLFNIKQSIKNKKIFDKPIKRRQGKEIAITMDDSSDKLATSNAKGFASSANINKSDANSSNMSQSSEEAEEDNEEEEEEEINQTNVENDENAKIMTNVEKNILEWKKINKLFKKNECENSFYVLSQTNKFRIICMKLIINKWFDRVILIVILFSTARLIIDTFLTGYIFAMAFEIIDAIFNVIFLFEAFFKICAMGFALDEGSYLRDNWNKIDILIVICSIFDFQNLFTKYLGGGASTSSLQFLKVLRLLRTLRPLRFISHNIQLKLIITSLFDSILPICNALFIVIVVYYMFSIIGISIFYSNLHNCYVLKNDGNFDLAISSFQNNLADYEIRNDMAEIARFCANKYNGIMDTGPAFKYSNIVTSIITSYVLSTQEGWPEIMNNYRIYSDYYGIFFLGYNLAVAYFVLNLFTGIMFRYFNEAYQKETKLADGDKKAPKYYDFLNQIYYAESHYSVWVHPNKGTIRYYLRDFADSSFLDNFIMIAIGANMLSMALNYENCPPWYDKTLTYANYVFTGIFIAECLLKLLAYGIRGYFHSGWNKFDFFVVFASIVDLIVANIEGIDAAFLKSFQIIRVLRVLRVTRVLRLVKSLKGLEKLIQTLSWSMTSLENVILLMVIIFSIFSILGVYFYDDIMYEDYKNKFTIINEIYNVDNFYTSFMFVFRCATGEKWHKMMMELAFVDLNVVIEAYAYIFMIISNFVNSIIMINLFLMVTLQQYDEFTGKSYNPIEKFESFLNDFNNSWNKFTTPEDRGIRIKKVLVTNFFMDFNWKKLNFPESGRLEHVKKYVSELKLRTDADDNVYFHDVIYKIILRQMGSQIDRGNPDNALIFRTEKKVADDVKKIINGYIYSKQKKETGPKNMLITFNPLTSHLYFKISYLYFKTFINYYKENSELLHHLDGENLLDMDEFNAENLINGEEPNINGENGENGLKEGKELIEENFGEGSENLNGSNGNNKIKNE